MAKLREHEPELRAAGVEHLLLHGSYARGTAVSELSDVDVIAEFDPGRPLSLLDMVGIEVRIPAKANADSEGNANGIPGRRRTVFGA